jgi:hypothetical protein
MTMTMTTTPTMKTTPTGNMASRDFYKVRSYSGCAGAAFNLLCSNFATIFKKTWLYAAVLSLIYGLYAFVSFPALTVENGSVGFQLWLIALAETAGLTLCLIVANSRTKAGLLALISGDGIKTMFGKHLKVSLILTGIGVAVTIAVMGASILTAHCLLTHNVQPETADTAVLCIFAVAGATSLCLFLPFAYSVTRYLLNDSRTREIFGDHYRTGLSHFGFLFVIAIIIVLMLMVAALFSALPAFITTLASSVDRFGVENGDATGLPSYFHWLSFLTNTVVGFVMTYIIFWIDLTFCYAYGTIHEGSEL